MTKLVTFSLLMIFGFWMIFEGSKSHQGKAGIESDKKMLLFELEAADTLTKNGVRPDVEVFIEKSSEIANHVKKKGIMATDDAAIRALLLRLAQIHQSKYKAAVNDGALKNLANDQLKIVTCLSFHSIDSDFMTKFFSVLDNNFDRKTFTEKLSSKYVPDDYMETYDIYRYCKKKEFELVFGK